MSKLTAAMMELHHLVSNKFGKLWFNNPGDDIVHLCTFVCLLGKNQPTNL